jgi:hypothetical protein
LLVFVICGLALPGTAAAEEPANCSAEKTLLPFVAEYTPLSPAEKAQAPQDSAVTFTFGAGLEATTLRFEAASSQSLLSTPDIDSGTATAQPGKFTFTSTKVTAKAGTLYWAFSFTHALKACGGELATYTTPVRKLEVIGTGGPSETSSSGSTTNWSPATTSSFHLRVGITAARALRVGPPTVAYVIDCTAACSGHTSVQAWQVRRRHRKTTRAAALNFGPKGVSIKPSSGGHERFSQRYRGGALKKLRSMLQAGEVKLQVSVAVKDASGKSASAQKVIWLRR